MWWSDAPSSGPNRRSRLSAALWLTAVLCLVPLLLTSCGFRPLYGKDSYNAAVMDDLASIQVMPMVDREGQLIHNALLTDFNPRGEPSKPRYRLAVTPALTETQQALRTDDTATRNLVTYNITYVLYENNTRVVAGSFTQMFSYDFLEEHYANISAADDIHRRAAQSVADEVRNRLAAYFAKAAEMKARITSK